ncbi:MAG: VOC family protein [Candidatus Adiutrix sp.]|jgi:catechol 2,3-dioxygenase-like lactoylglutathione lyase family enzyme|nr:VOC family protein [Candidatus Adiutrix sp.]
MKINKINIVIDCPDAGALAAFYQKFLGWELSHPPGNGWAGLTSPEGTVMAFQEVADYQPPVWPWQPGRPGQMLHLDYWVDDLETGVRHALDCGAVLAETQFFATSRTFFDPAGHPFCIDTAEPEPGSGDGD